VTFAKFDRTAGGIGWSITKTAKCRLVSMGRQDAERIVEMDQDMLARITLLENRLAIQDLRHRYWLAIVERVLETMMACYGETVHSQFGYGGEYKSRRELREFYRRQMSERGVAAQVPFGTNGLVTFIDETHAKGSWLISVVYIKEGAKHGTRNNVRYHETYVKVEDGWKIASQIVDYLCFEETTPVGSPHG